MFEDEEYMGFRSVFLQYIMPQMLLLGFAFMNTWFPKYTFLFIIVYIIVFGAIMYVTGKKTFKGRAKDLEEIRKGNRLYKAKPVEVRQLMGNDPLLVSEMKGQLLTTFMPFLSLLIIWFMFSTLKDILVKGEAGSLEMFIGYAILYEMFFVVSLITRLYQKMMVRRKGYSALMVLNDYVVTEKGIYSERGGGITLKFPIKAKQFVCNEKRNLIDIDVVQENPFAGRTIMRVRLYSKKVNDLCNKLKSKIVIEES